MGLARTESFGAVIGGGGQHADDTPRLRVPRARLRDLVCGVARGAGPHETDLPAPCVHPPGALSGGEAASQTAADADDLGAAPRAKHGVSRVAPPNERPMLGSS